MDKTIQAKNLRTEDFIAAINRANREPVGYACVQSVARILGVPTKVVCAKLRKLDRQGIVEGCPCGCSSPIFIVNDDGSIR